MRVPLFASVLGALLLRGQPSKSCILMDQHPRHLGGHMYCFLLVLITGCDRFSIQML